MLKEIKIGNSMDFLVSLELISDSREVGIHVMAEVCQSPGWIWNANLIGCRDCDPSFQGER